MVFKELKDNEDSDEDSDESKMFMTEKAAPVQNTKNVSALVGKLYIEKLEILQELLQCSHYVDHEYELIILHKLVIFRKTGYSIGEIMEYLYSVNT